MALVNRDKDVSEQKDSFQRTQNLAVAASAGVATALMLVPYPALLKAANIAALTISGAPQAILEVRRFTAAGVTTITVSATLTYTAYATSGSQGFSLVAQGSSLAYLQTGDVVQVNSLFSGGNVSGGEATITVVVQALQDIKSFFGSST